MQPAQQKPVNVFKKFLEGKVFADKRDIPAGCITKLSVNQWHARSVTSEIQHLKRCLACKGAIANIRNLPLIHLPVQETKQFQALPKVPASLLDQLKTSMVWEKLFNFQKVKVTQCLANLEQKMGQVLSCDTGTGKTIMSIAIARSFGLMGKVLILVPRIVFDNWKVEYGKFVEPLFGPGSYTSANGKAIKAPRARARKLQAFKGSPAGHFLLTHGQFTQSQLLGFDFNDCGVTLVIVDEAHKAKNCDTMIHSMLKNLRPVRMLLLTATPITNKATEIFALRQLIEVGTEAISKKEFIKSISKPLSNNFRDAINQHGVAAMRQYCENYLITADKNETDQPLPPLSEYTIWITFPPEYIRMYETLYEHLQLLDDNELVTQCHTTIIGFERAICADPGVLDQSRLSIFNPKFKVVFEELDKTILEMINEGTQIPDNPKWGILSQLIDKLLSKKEKILVYDPSARLIVQLVEIFQGMYGTEKVVYFTGKTTDIDRQTAMKSLNQGAAQICFISAGTGSLGVNLIGANNVIFTGQCWNYSDELQAVARTHRTGQLKPVMVFHLAFVGTIEQEQYRRQQEKAWALEALLKNKKIAKPMSVFENRDLYGIDELTMDPHETFANIGKFSPNLVVGSEDPIIQMLVKHEQVQSVRKTSVLDDKEEQKEEQNEENYQQIPNQQNQFGEYQDQSYAAQQNMQDLTQIQVKQHESYSFNDYQSHNNNQQMHIDNDNLVQQMQILQDNLNLPKQIQHSNLNLPKQIQHSNLDQHMQIEDLSSNKHIMQIFDDNLNKQKEVEDKDLNKQKEVEDKDLNKKKEDEDNLDI